MPPAPPKPRPDEPVRSRSHPLVKRLRALKERATADRELMLLEGAKLVDEALRAGVELAEAVISPRLERAASAATLRAALRAHGVVPRVVDDALLAQLSETETHQGVLALARRPAFREAQIFPGPDPLVVVLAGVQNPGNLGALLRTAEAAGAHGAYLTAGCADPFSWKALRGAMGSAFRLPHVAGAGLDEALAHLRARGLRVAATVAPGDADARSCFECDLRGPLALVFGSEGAGLPPAAARQADLRVTVPTAGAVESLNVGVAAGVVLFEAARQRRG